MSAWALSLVLFAGVVCGSAVHPRIVGGTAATDGQFSSIVQVDFLDSSAGTWNQRCAGTILNQIIILSAAHCFDGLNYVGPSSRRIRAGALERNTGGTIIEVSQVINHPDYGKASTFDADLGVITLVSLLTFSDTIQPSAIISAGSELPDNLAVTIAGWGLTEEGGSSATALQYASVNTVNREVCRQRYLETPRQHVVTNNMICAGLLDVGGQDACADDSGGPMFFDNVLCGITSWGEGCGRARFPGVKTQVSSYTEWIVATAS